MIIEKEYYKLKYKNDDEKNNDILTAIEMSQVPGVENHWLKAKYKYYKHTVF